MFAALTLFHSSPPHPYPQRSDLDIETTCGNRSRCRDRNRFCRCLRCNRFWRGSWVRSAIFLTGGIAGGDGTSAVDSAVLGGALTGFSACAISSVAWRLQLAVRRQHFAGERAQISPFLRSPPDHYSREPDQWSMELKAVPEVVEVFQVEATAARHGFPRFAPRPEPRSSSTSLS